MTRIKKCHRCGTRHEPIPKKKTEILGYQKVAPQTIPVYNKEGFNEIIDVFFRMHYNQEIPIIKAYPALHGKQELLVFWCDFCKCEHLHTGRNGHRTAHCGDSYEKSHRESPYYETGYFLNEPLLMGQKIFFEEEEAAVI
jgi:hypothetical protein